MKAGIITIKKALIWCLSLKRCIFYRTCSKWPPLHWWHIWIHPANLSIPLTLFFRYVTNLLIDGHFELGNGLRIVLIHVVLQEHPEIKIWGFRSGECKDHSDSRRLLISRLENWWSSHSIVILAVCEIAPSCWNHCTSWFTPRCVLSDHQTCSAHQCNTPFQHWLSPRLRFQTKTVWLFHVFR